MQVRIEGIDLPGASCGPSTDRPGGHHRTHIGMQRRGKPDELLGLTPGDAPSATWTTDCTVTRSEAGIDLRGPYVSGRPLERFLYLSWVTVDDDGAATMFRRAKLMFDGVPDHVLEDADRRGALVGRLGLTDAKGNPTCAAVRPPLITWTAAAPAS